uniref:Uncharacterized protein n=1 Tax=Sphaerodactylus townsendi TaxID=933632 RepID=A0ACB8ETK6_9SAUR
MSWMGVGTYHAEMDDDQAKLTVGLAAAQPLTKRSTWEVEKLQRDYKALQVHTESVSWERDQLREELGMLQQQVVLLLDERAVNTPMQSEAAATDVAMTGESEETFQGKAQPWKRQSTQTTGGNSHQTQGSKGRSGECSTQTPGGIQNPDLRLLRKRLKAEFAGDPEELAFFIIQVGSYMEVYGPSFRSEREKVFEVGTQLEGDSKTRWQRRELELGYTVYGREIPQ